MKSLTTLTVYAFLLELHLTNAFPTTYVSRDVTNTSKAGLAWPNADSVELKQFQTTGKISWYYTWSAYPTESDLEFVPMLWGPKSIDQFTSTINDTISQRNVTTVLGMNEPQEKGQSNMSPQDGAALWKQHLEPLRSLGVRLGSPAPSSAPSGKIWLQDFLTACEGGCTVDFIALHWYDVNATQFIEYLKDYHETFQRPLWVTEWACQNFNDMDKQCTQDDVVLFLNKTQAFMDETDYVERYSWFGSMKNLPDGVNPDNALMDTAGNINSLGKQYVGAEQPQTFGPGNADGPNAPGGEGNVSSANGVSPLMPRLTLAFLVAASLMAFSFL